MDKLNETVDVTEDTSINDVVYLTVEQACKVMNLGRNTILKLVKEKDFPARHYGKKILIDKSALPIWVSKHYGNYKI